MNPVMKSMVNALVAILVVLPGYNSRIAPAPESTQPVGLPIIIVPGKGGNRLEAKVNRTRPIGREHCPQQVEWYRIWMDLWTFLMGVDCWAENMQLRFNATTGLSSNAEGVETRVPGWGDTSSIEFVDPSWTAWAFGNIGAYASNLVKALTRHGYERSVNIRAAPYDFRFAPHSQTTYFDRLKELVEETSKLNGGSRVFIVGHSMGGLMSAHFLSLQSATWKDRYIGALMTISTPWAGAVVVAEMQAAGINYEIDAAIDRLAVRGQQRSYESGAMLLPHPGPTWTTGDVIVSTPSRNYTAGDYDDFFEAIGFPVGRQLLAAANGSTSGGSRFRKRPVGVPVYCTYSVGVPTPEMLVYDSDGAFPDERPRRVMGDGDGTVNLRSLAVCKDWIGVDDERGYVKVKEYDGQVSHHDIISDKRLINDIVDIAFSYSQRSE